MPGAEPSYYRDQILLRDERPRFHSKPRFLGMMSGPQLATADLQSYKNTKVPELQNKKCGTCHKLLNHNDVSGKNVLALSI